MSKRQTRFLKAEVQKSNVATPKSIPESKKELAKSREPKETFKKSLISTTRWGTESLRSIKHTRKRKIKKTFSGRPTAYRSTLSPNCKKKRADSDHSPPHSDPSDSDSDKVTARMFGFGSPKLEDVIFQLRFSKKQLEREAKKAEKQEAIEKTKIKKAIQLGNIEGARIYAENAIRKRNEMLNYLRYAGKIDAVQSRVQTAMSMQHVSRSLGVTVRALESVMQSMNLEKIQAVMDKFEKEFENLDVHSNVVEQSMSTATALSTPAAQVDALMAQIASENGLEIQEAMPSVVTTTIAEPDSKETQLERRLAALRE